MSLRKLLPNSFLTVRMYGKEQGPTTLETPTSWQTRLLPLKIGTWIQMNLHLNSSRNCKNFWAVYKSHETATWHSISQMFRYHSYLTMFRLVMPPISVPMYNAQESYQPRFLQFKTNLTTVPILKLRPRLLKVHIVRWINKMFCIT